ncbi:hypothetical protein PTTG_07148, partial [Puccinia triticina 1-1 BBBD Race 1]
PNSTQSCASGRCFQSSTLRTTPSASSMSLLAVAKPIAKPVVGVVIQSGIQPKTVKVLRTTQVLHRVVPKAIKKSVVYTVHDEKNSARRGDKVEIIPAGRRISTNKTYALSQILR